MSVPIVERLRSASEALLGHYPIGAVERIPADTMSEAADTITDLLAALEPFHREWLDMGATAHLSDSDLMLDVDCGGEILTVGHWRRLISCFAKAKGGAA